MRCRALLTAFSTLVCLVAAPPPLPAQERHEVVAPDLTA